MSAYLKVGSVQGSQSYRDMEKRNVKQFIRTKLAP